MKVVLVHDWLIHMRGGERVLEAIAEIYPDAPVYTLFYNREKLSPILQNRRIVPSFLHYLPGIRRYYRWLLPVLPWVIKTLRPEPCDLVLSTSHCVAKAVPVPRGAAHLCFCHTPMRYLWGFGETYFGGMPGPVKPLLNWILDRLRAWDAGASNKGVDRYIANSANVAERIRKYWGRKSDVVYPPVDTTYFRPGTSRADFYLVVSAFVPYKKVDLVIEAFNQLRLPLKIVGSGPLEARYRSLVTNSKIEFLGSVPDAQLRELHAQARGLIFPTDEDFGIVPLEAQAAGTPVIALQKGGALESVKSGVFFEPQTPEALAGAVKRFEHMTFDPLETARRVQGFDRKNFQAKIAALAEQTAAEASHGFAKK